MVSRRIVSLLVLVAVLGGGRVVASDRPPQDLRWVGDRWTAWDPPATVPEGTEIYTIERGDTLWDLAASFYGDPYLWPQIWELNRYIENAHWIYPGDPLALRPTVTPVDRLAAWNGAAIESPLPRREEAPAALGSEADLDCSGYVGEMSEVFHTRLVGSEHDALMPSLETQVGSYREFYGRAEAVKHGLSTGDIVYLDGGAGAGLSPGVLLTVVEPGETVRHPVTRDLVGRHYAHDGRIRILSVQSDTAIGEIVQTCRPIRIGSSLKPFVEEPVPLGPRTPMRAVNEPPSPESLADSPVVLFSEARLVSLGQGHLVHIDRGARDEVAPGDVFTVYRLGRQSGQPPVVLGELAVLSVRSHASLARILESRYPIHLGDRLETK